MHDIALIGAGRIGKFHAANLAANPRLRLARVVDPFPDAAAAVAAQYDARVSTIEEALADPAIAGVVVASSTDTHLPYSLAAAEAGKAIFCEKPLDQELAAARESAARFEALNARLFLAFNRRFDPNFAALQAISDWCARLTDAPIRGPWDKAVELAANRSALSALALALREQGQALPMT